MASDSPMSLGDQAGSLSSSNLGGDQESSAEGPQCKRLRSGYSRNHSFVRFRNVAQRRVKVIWINFGGSRVTYHAVPPGEFLDVNTFESHPWVFEDADTGDRMVVGGEEVFQPVAYNNKTDGWPPLRKEAKIGIPVYSLEERCLQIVRDMLSPEQVERASLPPLLRKEIEQAITDKHNFLNPCEQAS